MNTHNFSNSIIGHKSILEFLTKSIKINKISHAYLFYGPANVGKETIARRFLTTLLCQRAPEDPTAPCGKCLSCQHIAKGIHPDVYEVKKEEDKKNISIEQMRELQQKLSKHAFFGSYKIALIDQAETLSEEAWDCLLKTLEEPTAKTIIILITSKINFLPKTIISRSQLLRFLPVSEQEIRQYLETQGLAEKEINFLVQVSLGRPGRVINLLENPLEFKSLEEKINLCFDILTSDLTTRFSFVSRTFSPKDSFLENVNQLQDILFVWSLVIRKLAITKFCGGKTNQKISRILNQYSSKKLIELLKKIEQTKVILNLNVSPKLLLDNLVVGM